MIALAVDENFNNDVLRGLLRRCTQSDTVRIQDAGLTGEDDESVLAWAAHEGRVLISHDVSTLPAFAYARAAKGERMPGLFIVPAEASLSEVIEDLKIIVECSLPGEWEGQVRYLPLR